MKKFISFLILILIFSNQLTTKAYSVGGLQQFFKGIVRMFRGGTDDVIKSGDDILKNMGKTKEEILAQTNKSRGVNETISSSSIEAKIAENIGREQHSLHFTTLKNNTRTGYLKKLKDKAKHADELVDFFDFEELISDSKSNSTNKNFYSAIILNWVGKVYRNSDYYKNPYLEEKMLLVCSTASDVFYFSLLMEQEPKRAFLVEHKKLNNEDINSMISQELLVLEDSNEVKIMSSFPKKGNEWPSNYFTIYNNQGFEYDSLNLSLDIIKTKALTYKNHKHSCFKATNEGLL
tara:strand:- start:237 stop:1109 length:873 start_codon:yes stop_codon:yes gene_type:complete